MYFGEEYKYDAARTAMLATGFVAQGARTAVSYWRQQNDPDPLWVTDPLPSNYHIFVTKCRDFLNVTIIVLDNSDRKNL